MKIDGRLQKADRAFRRRWPSVTAWGAAVLVAALVPFPTEGHSALAFIGGAGLGGEILEQVLRISLRAASKSLKRCRVRRGSPALARRG